MNLKVTTVYSNSIEIEWKPGGLSDVINYQVKYRLYKNRLENLDGDLVTNDYNEMNSDNEGLPNQSNDYYDTEYNDDNYYVIITNNTRFKIGNYSQPLKPYTFYEFKVVAANSLGQSRETNTLLIRTAATSKNINLIN